MRTLTSRDGTGIAYDAVGVGPPVVVVDGALGDRAGGPCPSGKLAAALKDTFTVYTYDRRGRGDSGGETPEAVEREIEDLHALVEAVGEPVNVYGHSSGAALALEAANRGARVSRLALFEPPYFVDDSRPPIAPDFVDRTEALLAQGRRSDAVKLFLREGVLVPAPIVMVMRLLPGWRELEARAHTLPSDLRIVEPYQHGTPLPAGGWIRVTMPTLVMDGGKSPAWQRNAVHQLADVLPNGERRTLQGQRHMVKPAALARVLKDFFAAR